MNETYVEEDAYKLYNPSYTEVKPEELKGIPPPSPFLNSPKTDYCTWSWDNESRILLGNLKNDSSDFMIHPDDELYLLRMMERDDVTVILQGLVSVSNLALSDLCELDKSMEHLMFHKFRRYDRKSEDHPFKEVRGKISMTCGDFWRYLKQRVECTKDPNPPKNLKEFKFQENLKAEETKFENILLTNLYMYDVDIGNFNSNYYDNFINNMHYPNIMPGGDYCMMQSLSPNDQTFMGPNIYVTPGGSSTVFHQDGHGMVDSGHACITGYNEVVMLRRLTERHKRHALWLLTRCKNKNVKKKYEFYNGLYKMPHDDTGALPSWPSQEAISECEKMGYCPSVFILKPGQFVHINKGRLHAFRKLSCEKLPKNDCHAIIRNQCVTEEGLAEKPENTLCISIAWDWMYKGVTVRGINREIINILECTKLNQNNNVNEKPLAFVEITLLQWANEICDVINEDNNTITLSYPTVKIANIEETCRAILPALRYVIQGHLKMMQFAISNNIECAQQSKHEQYFGDSHLINIIFLCKICQTELSNVFYECKGCTELLRKHFIICHACYYEKKYCQYMKMHIFDNKKEKKLTDRSKKECRVNHTGNFKQINKEEDTKRCTCKRGDCYICHFCISCACRCHLTFTQQYRLFTKEQEELILKRVQNVVVNSGPIQIEFWEDDNYIKERFTQTTKKNEANDANGKLQCQDEANDASFQDQQEHIELPKLQCQDEANNATFQDQQEHIELPPPEKWIDQRKEIHHHLFQEKEEDPSQEHTK